MKTLAQYLAEYLNNEVDVSRNLTIGRTNLVIEDIKEIIKQGMDAYMSTENCEILIQPKLPIRYLECGCCEHYHREDYHGDCRNDAERLTLDDLEDRGIPDKDIIDLESDSDIQGI